MSLELSLTMTVENVIVKTIKFKSKWEKIDSLRLDEIDDHEIITAKFNNTHLGMISTSA